MAATQTSQLVVRLRDEVTGPAGKASRSLKNLKSEARDSVKFGATMANVTRGIAPVAGATLGVYGLASSLRQAYVEAAAFDRRMTRIGITADASVEATKGATRQVQSIAREVALPVNQITDGLESLVSQGRSLEDSLSFLPSVARTAQASGSAVDDIAKTADAVGTHFKIAGKDMQGAFDVMVQGGKAGQFELKDMARYLPSLAPAAAAIGLKGTEGLEQMVSMLQIVRKGTGTTEEAATSMANIFQKMESEETSKKFGKFGINLRQEMKKARKDGRNLLEVFEDLSYKAVKGDLSKLPQLFTDAQFATGMRALLSYRGEWQKLQAEIHKTAPGAVLRDQARVSADAQASVDNLANAWTRVTNAIGTGLDAAGVSSALNTISAALERHVEGLERTNKAMTDANNLRRIAREEMEKEGQSKKRFSLSSLFPTLAETPQSDKDKKILNDLSDKKPIRDNIGIGRGSHLLKDKTLNLNDLMMSDNEEIRKTAGERFLAQERERAAMYQNGDRVSALRRAAELNELAATQRARGGFGVVQAGETERKLFMVDHDLEVMRRTAQGRMARGQAAFPWAGDDSDARMPNVPLPPPRPADLKAANAANEAGQAIQALDTTVAPTVDISSIERARAEVRGLLADLAQLGPAMQGAGGGISSRSFRRQFESRQSGSFSDFEHR